MSAPSNATPGGGEAKSSGARSTASTSKPSVASQRACRPAPQATSSTPPPGRMKALHRRTQGEGGKSKWDVMGPYDAPATVVHCGTDSGPQNPQDGEVNATTTVRLSPYSPLWPAIFDVEARNLERLLDRAVRIEHIGSTAVPGLGAKPVIDVLVGAPDLAFIEARIPRLVEGGYRYVPEFERSIPQRRYFTRT